MTKRLVELCTNFQGKVYLDGRRIDAELLGWAVRVYAPIGTEKTALQKRVAEKAVREARGYSIQRETERRFAKRFVNVRYYRFKAS